MVPRVWFSFILAGFLVLSARAQSSQFTSATIRPSTAAAGERGGSMLGPNGSFVGTNVTLKQLIENAYRRFGFDRREVTSGPEWIASDRFDLIAEADRDHVIDPSGFPRETLLMVQRLIEDRFHLRIRHVLRERPVYAMAPIARAARPRLTAATAECASETLAQSRGDRSQRPQCGPSPYPGRLAARSITMADLGSLLTPYLDRPVIDRSGLLGAFDVDLEAIEIQPKGPFGPSYRLSDTKESIFNAIVSQLGLRLEKTTATIEILVVEHAEKPQPEKQDEAVQPAWRDPSPHQTRFVQVEPTVRMEILDWGGTGRPILFVGCYLTAHVYDEIAPKLTDRFHVYAVTRRGVGASDQPATGYDPQRRATDILEVIGVLGMPKPILIGNSCGGDILHALGARHPDRVGGLVYLDAAEDPTLTMDDYKDLAKVDMAGLPPRAVGRAAPVTFPESERRQMSASPLDPAIRKAVVEDNRVKPDYARIRVPVLAIYRIETMEQTLRDYPTKTDDQRDAVSRLNAGKAAMIRKWQRDLLAGVPAARIVELPGANLFMFLSNEADIIRELRAFAATLPQ